MQIVTRGYGNYSLVKFIPTRGYLPNLFLVSPDAGTATLNVTSAPATGTLNTVAAPSTATFTVVSAPTTVTLNTVAAPATVNLEDG